MNIVMVEPDGAGIHIFQAFRLPRLGAVLLATILRRLGHEVSVQVEVAAPLDEAALRAADLVGISTITSTATRAYALADGLRAAGVPVVLGGPHVTFRPEEALAHADWVVRGEGEVALPALVAAIEAGGGDERLAAVPNLAWWRTDGRLAQNPAAPPVDLDDLPRPDWTLVRAGVGPLGQMAQRTVPIQTSRGCPFDCQFCSVTEMFGRRMRYRAVEAVLEDLRPLSGSGALVFFYDDNFAANPKRVRAIAEGIRREGLKLDWSAQVRVDVARDPELLALMHASGCHTIYVGLESADPDALAAMDKRQTVAEMREALARIQAAGIHVHGMFVFGFDQDTPQSVAATVRFAKETRIASAQFLLLIPLPGTPVHDQMAAEGRLLDAPWDQFNGHHVVFRPRRFGLRELQQAQLDAHADFYSRRRLLGFLLRGRWLEAGINLYAARLNRTWQRRNRAYLRGLERPGLRLLRTVPQQLLRAVHLGRVRLLNQAGHDAGGRAPTAPRAGALPGGAPPAAGDGLFRPEAAQNQGVGGHVEQVDHM